MSPAPVYLLLYRYGHQAPVSSQHDKGSWRSPRYWYRSDYKADCPASGTHPHPCKFGHCSSVQRLAYKRIPERGWKTLRLNEDSTTLIKRPWPCYKKPMAIHSISATQMVLRTNFILNTVTLFLSILPHTSLPCHHHVSWVNKGVQVQTRTHRTPA